GLAEALETRLLLLAQDAEVRAELLHEVFGDGEAHGGFSRTGELVIRLPVVRSRGPGYGCVPATEHHRGPCCRLSARHCGPRGEAWAASTREIPPKESGGRSRRKAPLPLFDQTRPRGAVPYLRTTASCTCALIRAWSGWLGSK